MENVTNVALVGIVVLIVMCSKNGQSRSNKIDINLIVGVGLIFWLESDNCIRLIGLTGEYGQLIIEYGTVATILSAIAILIMDREKEKKGMERVGLIVSATLGMIILVGAEDLLTVYLAMEAQSLAFYTLIGLLVGILIVSSLGAYAVLCLGWASNSRYSFLGAVRAIAQMILYEVSIGLIILTVVLLAGSLNLTEIVLAQQSIWYIFPLLPAGIMFFILLLAETFRPPFDCVEAESKLVSGFHTEYSAVLLFYICSLASMVVGALAALNQSYIKRLLAYSAIAHVGYVLLALAVRSYTNIFSLLVYMVLYTISIIIFILLLSLPFTYSMMTIGSLSWMEFSFLTGLYSKDPSLELAYAHFFFHGTFSHLLYSHESVFPMMFPLAFLDLCSIFVGYLFKDLFVGLGSPLFSSHPSPLDSEFISSSVKLLPLSFLWFSFANLGLPSLTIHSQDSPFSTSHSSSSTAGSNDVLYLIGFTDLSRSLLS